MHPPETGRAEFDLAEIGPPGTALVDSMARIRSLGIAERLTAEDHFETHSFWGTS
jgi:hypothetical protein